MVYTDLRKRNLKGGVSVFNRLALKGKAIENGIKLDDLADKIGINPATLYRKMAGKSEFSRDEIVKIRDVLNLSASELEAIFFS
jgi:transcriptional regulator with XRE-family HTH domain